MKQDLEKAENAYLSSFTSKKSKTLPGATAAAHGDPKGKNDYQKKGGKVFNCKTIKNVKQSIKTIGPCYVCNKYGHLKVNCKEKKSLQKSPSTVNETFNTEFDKGDKGVWVIDTAATSHFCNDKSLFFELKPITNMKMSLATEDKSCPVEGIGTLGFRVKYKGSFHEITLSDVLFNPKLRRNLLSGSRLESKGAHFVGTKGRKPSVLHLIPFGCLAYAGVPKQIRKKFDMRAKMGIMMGYAQRTKGYRIWLIGENKLVETINKVNSNLGYNLNLPDYYYDDEDDFDRVKDSLTSRLVSKTSTQTPSTSEKPDVSSDNHSLILFTEVNRIRNIGRKVTGSNVYYSIEGEATRLKSFNEIERYCKRHNIEYDPSLFNFRKDNTESQGFSDLSEQQEALMVEVTIPNCYKQAIRSRDASKWQDAMDKEINVMMERKVWDLVDHPDNIKILENRWVYTIKYDEKNKIVRYKARLVARDDMIIFGKEMEKVNFVLQLLQKNFDLKIMGKTKKLLGIEFEEIGNSLFIHQRSYIRRLCEIFEKYKYPVSSLPISKGQLLSKLDSPKTSEEILTVPYRNLIGSLSFIAICTRPDIMYAVNVLSQFQANPGIKHWNCLLRLLGYLKYTQEYKLELSKVKSLKLRCYSDSDFATNRDDRVSMGGFITFIDESPISWRTFKQKSVSLSTMEAEYVSLTEAAKEFIWLKNVINNKSLNLELSENVMFCDNQAAISFSKSPVENYRTKHIDVRYHFLRNLIYDKVFQIKYIGTKNNLVDIFTKPMVKEKLLEFCRKLFLFRE
ncbi:retrovirus-related Pol polyprotein from transposon TNT 1-94 [Trichonephila clavipes]|nr:retrovirus-related Pol polyprotein from transposon TNT 1-94 [Trichonephila clavipes]